MVVAAKGSTVVKRLTVLIMSIAVGAAGLVGIAAPANADVAITLSVVNGTVGVSQTVSATVSSTTIGSPSGTVTFTAAGKSIGSQQVGGSSGSTAQVSWIPVAAGTIQVEATFVSDTSQQATDQRSVVIAKVDTVTSTSTPGTATTDSEILLTATVQSRQGQYSPSGSVSFFLLSGVLIGNANLDGGGKGTVKYQTPKTAGTVTVYAIFSGDPNANTSRSSNDSVKVSDKTSTVTLVVPQTNYVNTGVKLTAKVAPTSGTGSVEFLVNNKYLGTVKVAKGVAELTWVPNALGTFTLTANYSGGGGVDPGTATNKVTVQQQLKPDQITIDPAGTAGVWVPGTTITLSNGASVQLGVASASKLPVKLAVTGACALNGTTLTVKGAGGNCTLTASTAGGNGYAPASQTYVIVLGTGVQTATVRAPANGTYRRHTTLRLNRVAATTNIGQPITWRVTRKSSYKCRIVQKPKLFKVRLKRHGKCVVIGTSPAVPGQWTRFKVKRVYYVR